MANSESGGREASLSCCTTGRERGLWDGGTVAYAEMCLYLPGQETTSLLKKGTGSELMARYATEKRLPRGA